MIDDIELAGAIKLLVKAIAVDLVSEASISVAKVQLEDGRIAVFKVGLSCLPEDLEEYNFDCKFSEEPTVDRSKH